MALCGIPTRNLDGSKLPLDVAGAKKLAKYAVKHVYQFTSSRQEHKATAYEKFLLQIRDLLAIRFRMGCASFDPAHPIHPNNYPYFVGAFDTVAALGSLAQAARFAVLYAVASWFMSLLANVPLIGSYLTFFQFVPVFIALVAIPIAIALVIYVSMHVKFDLRFPVIHQENSLGHFTSPPNGSTHFMTLT